jgi:hypothetical protein
MHPPTFTWTEVLPHHLIESVCDVCTRRVAVSARGDLIHAVEKVHDCTVRGIGGLHPAGPPPAIPRCPHS